MRQQKLEEELKRLLEELRVALPGVQILFGFLLIAPFNQRFTSVTRDGVLIYCFALACTFAASMFLIAPSVFHRLYRSDDMEDEERMLRDFGRLATAGSVVLGLAVVSAMVFVTRFLFGVGIALLTGATCASLCIGLWYVLPLVRKKQSKRAR